MTAHTNIVTDPAEAKKTLNAISVAAFDASNERYIGEGFSANNPNGYDRDDAEALYQLRTILQPLLSCTVSEFRALALPTARAIEAALTQTHDGGFHFNITDTLGELEDAQQIAGCVQDWALNSHDINIEANDENDAFANFIREINAAMNLRKAEAA